MRSLSDLTKSAEGESPQLPTPPVAETIGGIPVLDDGPSVKETARAMAETLVTGKTPPRRSIADAFDSGAKGPTLVFTDSEPKELWRKNPVPSGKSRTKPTATRSTRPAGAEDLQGLFATGLILLLVFGVGEWATPTADEASAIAAPLANIVARRIDLATKLGKDANDTIALAVALMSYAARVGPLAVERFREEMDERRRRAASERVDRAGTTRPADSGGAGGVASGEANGSNPLRGAYHDPVDAIAKARSNGRSVLERDLGPTQGQGTPVAGGW